eukprot:gene29034-29431_t
MPALGWAAPDQALPSVQQQRRSSHTALAVQALEEAWAVLARMQLARSSEWLALLDQTERICANLETGLAGRRRMNRPLDTVPDTARCRSVLADGRLLTITASRRPRANRADVKCTVAAAPALAQRMQQVVRMARLTEAVLDTRDQVVLSMDVAPTAQERDWELAAVLADRMVRGVYRPAAANVLALGSSDAWHLGRLRQGGVVSGAVSAAL